MKIVTKILMVFVLFGCSGKANQGNKNINETKVDSVSKVPEFDYYNDAILTHIDAEELCEFNFEFFLPQLNKILKTENLKLEISTTEDYRNSYEIMINEKKIKLYSNEELSNGKFWETGPSNFFRTINDIINENKLDKQFYLLYSANDLNSVFLNKDQFRSMVELNKNNKRETPYSP